MDQVFKAYSFCGHYPLYLKRLISIGLIAICVISCGERPTSEESIYDDGLSHGALDPNMQEKLNNPETTYQELKEKYERARTRRLELQRQILQQTHPELIESIEEQDGNPSTNYQPKTFDQPFQESKKNWFESLRQIALDFSLHTQHLASAFGVQEQQTSQDHSTTAYEAELIERIEIWTRQALQDLEDGTRTCQYWSEYWCRYKIIRYEQQTIKWIERPLMQRVQYRAEGAGLKDQLRDNPDLDSTFWDILENLEKRDILIRLDHANVTIDNEIWPELSYEEKVERWANEALENVEQIRPFAFWEWDWHWSWDLFRLNQVPLIYKSRIIENRDTLLEWASKEEAERHFMRRDFREDGRTPPDFSASLYEHEVHLKAIYDLIAASDYLTRRQREQDMVNEYMRLTPWERQERQDILDEVQSLDFREQLEAINRDDEQIQNRLDQQVIDWWDRLGYERRTQRIHRGSGIRDRWDISQLDEHLLTQLDRIEEQDRQVYNAMAQEAVDLWASQTSQERIDGEDIRNDWDLSRLNENLITQIQNTEVADVQYRFERLSVQVEQIESLSFEERQDRRQARNNLLYSWHRDQRRRWFPQDVSLRYTDMVNTLSTQLSDRMDAIEHQDEETLNLRLIEANNEKFVAWMILPHRERSRLTALGQGIETQLSPDHITPELEGRLLALEERDRVIQDRIIAMNNERIFEEWEDLSLDEKERLIARRNGIESQLDANTITSELRERIRESLARDDRDRTQLRVQENVRKFERWDRLSLMEKDSLDARGDGIESQLDTFYVSRELRQRIDNSTTRDDTERRRLAQDLITRVKDQMPHIGRLESARFFEPEIDALREYINEYRLPYHLREELRELEHLALEASLKANELAPQYASIEESRSAYLAFYLCEGDMASTIGRCGSDIDNLTNEYAQARAEEDRYGDALRRYEDMSVSEYENMRVKIFPIGNICGYRSDVQYNLTCQNRWRNRSRVCRTNLMSFSFNARNGGYMRLEVHNGDSGQVFILVNRITRLQLEIPERYNLNSPSNLIRYVSGGREETYLLKDLLDYTSHQRLAHIRVVPQNSSAIQLSWRGGSRSRIGRGSYRGSFLIQASINRRDGDREKGRSEWSVINDVPLEQYNQSTVPGEMPVRNTDQDALMAQAILVRSYALNNAVTARKLSGREWDLNPTVCFQAYRGVGEETARSTRAVRATEGLVLTHRNRPAFTEYHASWIGRTKRSLKNWNVIIQPRVVPNGFDVRRFGRFGHGKGMPQRAAMSLARDGWTGTNSPSSNAILPPDIHTAWTYQDILNYFYDRVEMTDWQTLYL